MLVAPILGPQKQKKLMIFTANLSKVTWKIYWVLHNADYKLTLQGAYTNYISGGSRSRQIPEF